MIVDPFILEKTAKLLELAAHGRLHISGPLDDLETELPPDTVIVPLDEIAALVRCLRESGMEIRWQANRTQVLRLVEGTKE